MALAWWLAAWTLAVPLLESDYSGPPIPYDHLASEKTDPFLIGGNRPTVREWRRPIERYANVRDCLVRQERRAEVPDLRRINWEHLGGKERGVCVWRIFASLGTPERAAVWMAAQGLRVNGPRLVSSGSLTEVYLSGGYSPTRDGRMLPGGTLVWRWITTKIVYGVSVIARWSEDGKLSGVAMSSSAL